MRNQGEAIGMPPCLSLPRGQRLTRVHKPTEHSEQPEVSSAELCGSKWCDCVWPLHLATTSSSSFWCPVEQQCYVYSLDVLSPVCIIMLLWCCWSLFSGSNSGPLSVITLLFSVLDFPASLAAQPFYHTLLVAYCVQSNKHHAKDILSKCLHCFSSLLLISSLWPIQGSHAFG